MYKLLRIKDWLKNLFVFLPVFFAGSLSASNFYTLLYPFFSFCFFASAVYILNDLKDVEFDKLHPEKRNRAIASGRVSITTAIIMGLLLLIAGTAIACLASHAAALLVVLFIYLALNVAYSLGLKKIAILDILILSSGFVLRVRAGSAVTHTYLSEWLIVMVFLLALFMSIAKRRDDLMLKHTTGQVMRHAINGYSLEYLNTLLALFSAIIIVAYILYTVSPDVQTRMGTDKLFYTCVFVIAGILRYLQISLVLNKACSPTDILYRDRFIQITLLLWMITFYAILYLKNVPFLQSQF